MHVGYLLRGREPEEGEGRGTGKIVANEREKIGVTRRNQINAALNKQSIYSEPRKRTPGRRRIVFPRRRLRDATSKKVRVRESEVFSILVWY